MNTVMLAAQSTAIEYRCPELAARAVLPAKEGPSFWRRMQGLAAGLAFLAARVPLYVGLLIFGALASLVGAVLYGSQAIGLRLMRPSSALAATALALVCIAGSQRAHADTIPGDSPLLQQTTLVFGQQTNLYSFDAPGAGTLAVTLRDLEFPVALQQLTASILASDQVLGSLPSNGGSFDVPISTGGLFDAFVASQAGTLLAGSQSLQLGAYSMSITFQPAVSPVPLPPALALLAGGMGLLGAVSLLERISRRRNGDVISVA